MKKLMAIMAMFLLCLAVSGLAVANVNNKGKNSHLDLVAKDTSWNPIMGGASGKLNYGPNEFVFNGEGLVTGTEYTLLSYAEPWPSTGSVILGTAVADSLGEVHIKGAMPVLVINTYTSGDYAGISGSKIWLVPSADLTNGAFNKWNPSAWLFETRLI